MISRPHLPVLLLSAVWTFAVAGSAPRHGRAEATTIYFVRHGEVEESVEGLRLNAQGTARALDLARTLSRVPLKFVFASHTLRAQQTVEPAAHGHGLTVVQVPTIGSRVGETVVDGTTPSKVAIGPLADALLRVPQGSVVLVGVNSDNVFAILHRLGVPAGTPQTPCAPGGVSEHPNAATAEQLKTGHFG